MAHDLSEFDFMYSTNEFGTIVDPGKYEGEPLWAAYFGDHNCIQPDDIEFPEGYSDNGCEYVEIYQLNDDDRETFSDLEDEDYVALVHTTDGFVTAFKGSLWSIHKTC